MKPENDTTAFENFAAYGALSNLRLVEASASYTQTSDNIFKLIGVTAENISLVEQSETSNETMANLILKVEQERYENTHDHLTGLLNRRGLIELGQQQIAPDKNTAVIFLDVDKFKSVNDTYGHDKGDELLITIGKIIANNVRETDLVSRLGGDEFVVVMDTTPSDDAEDLSTSASERVQLILERIQNALIEYLHFASINLQGIGISGGFTIFDPVKHSELEDLMRESDALLYINKLR